MKTAPMSSFKEFSRVFVINETRYGKPPSDLDVERAYKRLLKITGETAAP
jgi:hypothetical protein